MSEEKERFRILFENSMDPVLLISEYKFSDCNEAALRVMNCSRDQLIGLRPFNISPGVQPDGRFSSEKDRELIDIALARGVNRFEWRFRTFDGADLWADVSLIAIPFKDKRVLHATWRNITREKQMEQDFQTQIERFLAIADNSRFATVLVDAGGRWIYTNAKFKGLLGYDLYDIPDEAAWFLAAYPDSNYRSMVLKKCREAMKGIGQDPSLREGREFTVTMTCKDKTQRLIHATLVRMPTGECLKTFMDVTEEQRMKEGLKRTQAQLVMKSAQLRGLNAAMKVLLRSRHDAQVEMELSITENINKLILPVIGELKKHPLDAYSVTRVEMIEQNIQNVVSPFLHNLTTKYSGLTLREMQISDLVKSGRSTKEIAQALRISQSAVSFHRSNIRRKIGITNQKTSLPTYLSRHRDGE